jgi:squalene-hopene/tetraprenyl-beta-curcumene cyclase
MSKSLDQMISQVEELLVTKQKPDGSWVGEVELNPGPTAQALMLYSALNLGEPAFKQKALNYILRTQNTDGGWVPHYGAPSEIGLTLECYVGMRLAGLTAEHDACVKAREFIFKNGNLQKANPWTKLYFGILGIVEWDLIPKIPTEVLLVPQWTSLNVSNFAYWVKVITLPMILVHAHGPYPAIPLANELSRELKLNKLKSLNPKLDIGQEAIEGFFKSLTFVKLPVIRKKAIEAGLKRVFEYVEEHGDIGGNTCTAINLLVLLNKLGRKDSTEFKNGLKVFLTYAIETETEWRLQCCQSHIWDTAFSLYALQGSSQDKVQSGKNFLLERQILNTDGPWSYNVKARPGGWCFGNRHDHFPVTDCTACSVIALGGDDPEYFKSTSAQRAVEWLMGMQSSAGGWAAYEKCESPKWAENLFSFKDMKSSMVDSSKGDVSAKVIEALALSRTQFPEVEPALQKARTFLLKEKDDRGLWKGNYGINYIYGTSFSARALRAIDQKTSSDWAPQIKSFFLSKQNADGGWGEVEESYRKKELAGVGASNAIQTAWALMGLIASSEGDKATVDSVKRAISYLSTIQESDGSWDQTDFVGTVFPEMVYFRYEYYGMYFPLMALKAAKKFLKSQETIG